MKLFKSFVRYLFTTFGVNVALLGVYIKTVENPTHDWFIAVTTALLSAVCGAWICDVKK